MELHDYPRPSNDSGIGMHWSASNPAAVGITDLRDFWIPELRAMGVSWVKLLHDGGEAFAELLLQNDIMPVVRLYRYRPNSPDSSPGKGTLGQREIEYLDRYLAVGVRYFEFNNEPDVHGEWDGGQVPPNAETIVAHNAIIDMETILQHGGYPGVPATAIGNKWDLVGKIIQLGRANLFEGPVWLAVHNYDINHPLDYPYDPINQDGQQLTPKEYELLDRQGAWAGRRWGHRSLAFVNEQRRLGVNSGDTIHDDPSCWLAYARLDELAQKHLGHRLPILSTENGPIVGEDDDPRYPTTTIEAHRDKVLDIGRIMMSSSERFTPAPPHYFCTAFWLIAGTMLFGTWESHAWYSPTRPGGRLPVVDALKALPKHSRPDFDTSWQKGLIDGHVRNGAGRALVLDGPVTDINEVASDEAFRFASLRAGSYTLEVRDTQLRAEARVTRAHPHVTLELELAPELAKPPQESVLSGHVRGGSGFTLRLSGPTDRLTTIAADETYRFADLPAGTYALAVENTAVSVGHIELDGHEALVVDLQVGGWTWEIWDGGHGPGFGVVRCTVEGLVDLPVHLWTHGWAGITQRTGSKAEYGPTACEFAPLGGARYIVEPEGLGVSAEVSVDGSRVVWVAFRRRVATIAAAAERSAIHGRVSGGSAYALELHDGGAFRSEIRLADDGTYRFAALPPGTYTLRLLRLLRHDLNPGEWTESKSPVAGQVREGLALDGASEITVDFDVLRVDPQRGTTALNGMLHEGAGQSVVLRWPGGYGSEQWVEDDGSFYFDELGPGMYELEVKGTSLRLSFLADGQQDVSLELWMPSAHSGVIWGRVPGGAGRQIVLSWPGGRQETTIAPNSIYRFAYLPPGEYELTIQDISIAHAGTRLGTDETVQVDLDMPSPKPLDHYLLLRGVPGDWPSFAAVMRYAARFAPVLGDNLEAAQQAAHVVIVGDEQAVSAAEEQCLLDRGCQVLRIAQDAAAELERLVKEGKPH